MLNDKEILDERICDIEGGRNTQTYREFIRESEEEFGLEYRDLESMTDKELNDYVEYLDYLWTK